MEVTLPKLHPGQMEIFNSPARFKVCCIGRRYGKSMLAAVMCIVRALKKQRCWWIAPDFPQAQIGWKMLLSLAKQIPGINVSQEYRLIVFPSGGEIQLKSAVAEGSLRGEGLDFVVFDEASLIAEEVWTESIRPALMDRKGDALFISTPRGYNWFYELFMYAKQMQENGNPDWFCKQAPSKDNPFLAAGEIDALIRDMPQRAIEQEIYASFLSDGGSVFRGVSNAVGSTPQDERIIGHEYYMGVDFGRVNDFTVITVVDATLNELVYMERFNQINYTVQVERIIAVSRRFLPSVVTAEENASRAVIELLSDANIPLRPFTTTSTTKMVILDKLAVAIESTKIRLLNEPVLLKELKSFTSRRTPGGTLVYSAPEGDNSHDDCVMSLALCFSAVPVYNGTDWSMVLRPHVLDTDPESNPWIIRKPLKDKQVAQQGRFSNRFA